MSALESNACVFSCQQGRYLVVATDFSAVAFAALADLPLGEQTSTPHLPFTTGYIGLISYDAYARVANPTPPVFWRIDGAIVIDTVANSTWLTGSAVQGVELFSSHPHQDDRAAKLTGDLRLCPDNSDAHYFDCVRRIVADIRAGRYYLLNYLRFFALQSELDLHELLTSKFIRSAAPYKALLRWNDQVIYSFSPEQFVSINQRQLRCLPIKGTARRSQQDNATAQALQCSEKDLAELHITIDLARNDIGAIATDIRVIDAGRVRSFNTVHHLVATIQASLAAPITLREFLPALCPAASISGAPKIEVMQAISEYESQPRGYFMGNIICIDDSGMFDSSVLIRTVWCKGDSFSYAAGGGITLSSTPAGELQEVETKTLVLLD